MFAHLNTVIPVSTLAKVSVAFAGGHAVDIA
jgi:hypothetical protein